MASSARAHRKWGQEAHFIDRFGVRNSGGTDLVAPIPQDLDRVRSDRIRFRRDPNTNGLLASKSSSMMIFKRLSCDQVS